MKQNLFSHLLGLARHLVLLMAMAIAVLVFASPPQIAEAATLVVNIEYDNPDYNCTSSPHCSLRGAIIEANRNPDPDTIKLPAGTYRLDQIGANEDAALTGDLDIIHDLVIEGAGAATTIIDGNGTDRVFEIAPSGVTLSHTPIDVKLSGITVRNGNPEGGNGGGIRIGFAVFDVPDFSRIDAKVELSDSRIEANHGGSGGGIFNGTYSKLTLSRTLVYNNTALFGAGIENEVGEATIVNSTISTNRADKSGGGIKHIGSCQRARVISLINSTIAFNVSDVDNDANFGGEPGGGIRQDSCGQFEFLNTIIANNTDEWRAHESPPPSDCYPKEVPNPRPPPDFLPVPHYSSQGFNIDTDGSCNLQETGDQPNTKVPVLEETLAADGTHHFAANSPALDKGQTATCEKTDQLKTPRPQDSNGDGVAVCDIGAYEAPSLALDSFSLDAHPNGRLGDNWGGTTGLRFYRVVSASVNSASGASQSPTHVSGDGILDVGLGGPIFWKQELGADQQAGVKFVKVDPAGIQSLLLKVKPDWKRRAIAVYYNPITKRVGIATFMVGKGLQILQSIPMTLRDGDQLSGRAQTDGSVQAYVNGFLVLEANAGTDFQGNGGVVGLLFINADRALLDDFSGSTIP